MSSPFQSSSRPTKRRRTTRYSAEQTILSDDQDNHSSVENSKGKSNTLAESIPLSVKQSSKRTSQRTLTSLDTETVHREDVQNGDIDLSPSNHARTFHTNGEVEPSSRTDDAHNGQPAETDEAISQTQMERTSKKSPEDADATRPRSSGRQRKKPNRFADSVDPDENPLSTKTATENLEPSQRKINSPTVKGILTPSRRQKTPRPRKSVMFDQDEAAIGEKFGFRDIDTQVENAVNGSVEKRDPRKTKRYSETSSSQNDLTPTQTLIEDIDIGDLVTEELQHTVPIPDVPLFNGTVTTQSVDSSPDIQAIKRVVLSRLANTTIPRKPPAHLELQYKELHSLLDSTIVSSESNSLLLLGPRGSGKTLLLSMALQQISTEHSSEFHTVHLNGFLQTDDRLALREIWRQLGREMQVDEMETEDVAASYADTMVSLLSLLSHPDELVSDETYTQQAGSPTPNGTNPSSNSQNVSKSIVFILDEFDLFTTHPRQTLLYNLFDIAQSKKAPIAVIGCSTRMDVIECLEKRVKSRFSHRWQLISPCKTFLEWERCVRDTLLIVTNDTSIMGNKEDSSLQAEWNKHLENILLPSKDVQFLLRSHFYSTKSLPDLFTALYPMIAEVVVPASSTDISNNSSISTSTQSQLQSIKMSPSLPEPLPLLQTLPGLHTSLLIAHSRLETIHHLPSANFNLIFTHYTELINQARLRQSAHGSISVSGSLRCWSRETCREAWEDLGNLGLVVPVTGTRDDGTGESDIEETRMWKVEVTLEDLIWGIRERGGDSMLERWCKEV